MHVVAVAETDTLAQREDFELSAAAATKRTHHIRAQDLIRARVASAGQEALTKA